MFEVYARYRDNDMHICKHTGTLVSSRKIPHILVGMKGAASAIHKFILEAIEAMIMCKQQGLKIISFVCTHACMQHENRRSPAHIERQYT